MIIKRLIGKSLLWSLLFVVALAVLLALSMLLGALHHRFVCGL